MHALFIVLNHVDHLDDILEKFLEIGITGATILDSQGMGSAIAQNHSYGPLFGSLKKFLNNSRPFNKTIFTLIENEDILDMAMAATREILGDMTQPGVGLMFSVAVGKVEGLRPSNSSF